jgi:ribosomal protein S18 acetylase RimI-like enzyme
MGAVTIRNALPEDGSTIIELIRAMVTDIASYGGYPPATDYSAWEALRCLIVEELLDAKFSHLLAVATAGEIAGIGAAELITLGGAFAPKKILHISVLYVRPHLRRRRIGDALMTELLAWGSASGAVECDLNVLVRNPAQALYARHGFSPFQVKMVRPLTANALSVRQVAGSTRS